MILPVRPTSIAERNSQLSLRVAENETSGDTPDVDNNAAPATYTSKRSLLRGGSWVLINRISAAAFFLVANALLARSLPPDEMAGFLLSFSFVIFCGTLGGLGLHLFLVREMPLCLRQGDAETLRTLLRRVYMLGTVGSVGVGLAFFFWVEALAYFFPRFATVAAVGWTVAVWIVLQAVLQIVAESLRGLRHVGWASFFGGASGGAAFALSFLLLIGGNLLISGQLYLKGVATWATVSAGAGLIGGAMLLAYRLKFLSWQDVQLPVRYRLPGSLRITSEAVPYMMATVCILLMNQVDLWIVGSLCSAEETAIYGCVSRLMFVTTLPLIVVNGVMAPMISDWHSRGRNDALQRMLRLAASGVAFPAILMGTIALLWGDGLLGLMFGPRYSTGGTIFALLCLGQIGFACGGSSGLLLMMSGHARAAMLVNGVSVVGLSLLAVLGASLGGATAVAAVAAGAWIVNKLLLVLMAYRQTGIRTYCYLSIGDLRETITKIRQATT